MDTFHEHSAWFLGTNPLVQASPWRQIRLEHQLMCPMHEHGVRAIAGWHGCDEDGGVCLVAGRAARTGRWGLCFRCVAAPPGQETPNCLLVAGFLSFTSGACSIDVNQQQDVK